MCQKEKYRDQIRRILSQVDTDENTALAMIMLTATLMDLCPWDERVTEMVITDCRRPRHVDLREPESRA